MPKINSRAKGAAGERQWATYLSDRGYPARRGQQFSGGVESPDVVCETLKDIHWEVKRVQKLNIHDAVAQAIRDAGCKLPVVAHRKNGETWLITLRAEDFFEAFVPGYSLGPLEDEDS